MQIFCLKAIEKSTIKGYNKLCMYNMDKLKSEKTTFMLIGSNKKTIEEAIAKVKKEHEVRITKTDVLNIAVDVFLHNLITEDKSMEDYLIQYNKL